MGYDLVEVGLEVVFKQPEPVVALMLWSWCGSSWLLLLYLVPGCAQLLCACKMYETEEDWNIQLWLDIVVPKAKDIIAWSLLLAFLES